MLGSSPRRSYSQGGSMFGNKEDMSASQIMSWFEYMFVVCSRVDPTMVGLMPKQKEEESEFERAAR